MEDKIYNLLIIDDDEIDRKIVFRHLKNTLIKFKKYEASDCEGGFAIIKSLKIDCIFLDYQLPYEDGLDFVNRLREKKIMIPVVILTGQGDEFIAVELMKAGANDYLNKNALTPELLQRSLQYILKVTETERELNKARNKAQKYLDVAAVVLLVIEADGRVSLINKKGCEILEYEESEILDKNWYANFVPYSKQQEIRDFMSQMCLSENSQGMEIEYDVLTKSRTKKIISWNNVALFDENENFAGILCSGEDITIKRHLEEQLAQLHKMETLGNLAGGIAHDFNNILGSIIGYISLIKKQITLEHTLFKYIDTIDKSANRAAELTSKLLAFSHGGKYQMEIIDLNEIIRETLAIVSHTMDKSINIETRLCELPVLIKGDASQIEQVVMNLCVNAAQAMESQGGLLLIETLSTYIDSQLLINRIQTVPGQYVLMIVSDTGCGMDSEVKEHIFEPFFTTKEKGKGTGLGLSMVYGITRNHKGFIDIYSELGKGSTFKVYLPLCLEKGEPVAFSSPREQNLNGVETILVVDDEEFLRELAYDILSASGYTVLTAADGDEALELYSKRVEDIDLVILDMIMPNKSGYEVFQALKKVNPSVKTILASGFSKTQQIEECLKTGIINFLQKPYTAIRLLDAVRSVLDYKC